MGSHTFNPSTRGVETGVIWLGGDRNIRWEETGLIAVSLVERGDCSLRFGGDSCSLRIAFPKQSHWGVELETPSKGCRDGPAVKG